MKKYDPEKAIRKVNLKIKSQNRHIFFSLLYKGAAVLFILLISTLIYFTSKKDSLSHNLTSWNTLEIPSGVRSECLLPDSTKVYLNSGTVLKYPEKFNDTIREVILTGEAYFEVVKNTNTPFIVNTRNLNIEVTGTHFKAVNYPHENLTEIVLIEGSINLFRGNYFLSKKDIIPLVPGEIAFLENGEGKELTIKNVDIQKYRAWKDGVLIFRDDSMQDVVRRLNRWFNVEIKLTGSELTNYVYTATFQDESLLQILELLKISAPIEYNIIEKKRQTNGSPVKMEIEIKQKLI
jgi:ferric-dicitrate binding protein FerR (iron transport regulator)